MGRFFPCLGITVMAAMALLVAAYPDEHHHDEIEHYSPWVPVPHAETDENVQYLGEFAVESYDEQTRAYLKFIQVVEAQVLDRGTEHYTYHLVLKAHDGHDVKLFNSIVFQDFSGHEEPPLLNLGHFEPL